MLPHGAVPEGPTAGIAVGLTALRAAGTLFVRLNKVTPGKVILRCCRLMFPSEKTAPPPPIPAVHGVVRRPLVDLWEEVPGQHHPTNTEPEAARKLGVTKEEIAEALGTAVENA
jgi:hypothetical protein